MATQGTVDLPKRASHGPHGRVCVFLGVLAGPGPEIARALARDGCHVVLADSDFESLQNLAASIVSEGSQSPACCLIRELDKPYRDSNFAICAGGADSIIDNREWTDYTCHSVSLDARAARQPVRRSPPSIYLLSVPAPDPEMNALLALDLIAVMRSPSLILSPLVACRLMRGKIRWYRVQRRFGEIENLIELALSHILTRTTNDGRMVVDNSKISKLMVELFRGSDSPRSLFRL